MLVESWLARAARTRPDAIALRAEDGVLRYGELLEAATAAAQRLSALGVAPGDRVGIALPARRPSPRRSMAACCSARRRCPSTCA